jgi:hypothetical protein
MSSPFLPGTEDSFNFMGVGMPPGVLGHLLNKVAYSLPPDGLLSLLGSSHLAQYFYRDPEELKKIEDHNMAVVFDAADKAFFKASLERPAIRRMANGGSVSPRFSAHA